MWREIVTQYGAAPPDSDVFDTASNVYFHS